MTSTNTRGLLQIGDVAERTGLSLRSVRHYEEVGLLPAAERSPGGFRLYTDATVDRLLVIKQLKPLDFTLDEMRELLDALDALAAAASAKRRAHLLAIVGGYQAEVERRIEKVTQRLAAARALNASLQKMLDDRGSTLQDKERTDP